MKEFTTFTTATIKLFENMNADSADQIFCVCVDPQRSITAVAYLFIGGMEYDNNALRTVPICVGGIHTIVLFRIKEIDELTNDGIIRQFESKGLKHANPLAVTCLCAEKATSDISKILPVCVCWIHNGEWYELKIFMPPTPATKPRFSILKRDSAPDKNFWFAGTPVAKP